MKVRIQLYGIPDLKGRVIALAELAKTDKVARKGMSNAARIVARYQKGAAPVRQNKNQKKFKAIAKVVVGGVRMRPIGPQLLLPPGVLQRSIGYRVKKEKGTGGEYSVVIGANVGKKKKSPNFAPHAAFVGSGTVERSVKSWRGMPLHGEQANRGKMRPNPYIRRATALAVPAAMKAIEDGVHAELAAVAVR